MQNFVHELLAEPDPDDADDHVIMPPLAPPPRQLLSLLLRSRVPGSIDVFASL